MIEATEEDDQDAKEAIVLATVIFEALAAYTNKTPTSVDDTLTALAKVVSHVISANVSNYGELMQVIGNTNAYIISDSFVQYQARTGGELDGFLIDEGELDLIEEEEEDKLPKEGLH